MGKQEPKEADISTYKFQKAEPKQNVKSPVKMYEHLEGF